MRQPSEVLTTFELEEITGRKSAKKQMDWLETRCWIYEINSAGRPVVGRVYARIKLGGITPTVMASPPARKPNFEAIKRG